MEKTYKEIDFYNNIWDNYIKDGLENINSHILFFNLFFQEE
jgi:hypothetical protein